MKKVILILVTAFIILAVAVTGFGENDTKKLEKEIAKIEENANKKFEKVFKTNDMESLLRKNNLYEDEFTKNMTKYLKTVIEYNLPDEVNEIFLQEVAKGKDLDKLITIFEFLFNANKNYNLIPEMYEYGEKSNFKQNYWYEHAYNELTDCAGGVLSGEEIAEYINKGLSYDDILTANELCFSGKMKINEILAEKLKGKEWVDIINKVYPKLNINKSIYKDVKNYELLQYVKNSNKYGEDINEMYDKKEKKLSQKSEIKKEKRNAMINKIKADKKFEFNLDNNMLEYAKKELPGIEKNKIEKLMEEGYLIREIKQGIKLSEEFNTSLEDAMKINYIKEAK